MTSTRISKLTPFDTLTWFCTMQRDALCWQAFIKWMHDGYPPPWDDPISMDDLDKKVMEFTRAADAKVSQLRSLLGENSNDSRPTAHPGRTLLEED